ncbi:unnamed protein product [Adineta ricciae]|uniref:Uncharacterized protein n=1 Tax=Adineta ricciae TaxID=249248 RepID=A0A814ZYN3_ADIRI|nr:unnamed protein product [Adineta ricciae]CAF1416080.1 unnamed protein product [Adineta ricciae]
MISILTETTNQLTRKTLINALNKSSQLSFFLQSYKNKLAYEDTHFIAMHILESITHIHTGINGPLQQRMQVLQFDLEDFSFTGEHDLHHSNFEYQKQLANEVTREINEILSMITSVLDIHLHLNQCLSINTSSISFLLKKTSSSFVSDHCKADFSVNSTVLIRMMTQPLAPYGNSTQLFTNLSRSFSFSVFDEDQHDIQANRMEFVIPRDPNWIVPPMFYQNVTIMNEKNFLFHFYSYNLTKTNGNQTFSIHFEIHPLNPNISYFLIHQFDDKPQMNPIQNWTFLCPSDFTSDQTYLHFIDNRQTSNHHSIVYGIRELVFEEMNEYCSNKTVAPIVDQPRKFSSDYEIRLYQSSCFYLDSNNNWQSNRLVVGRLTNLYQTQCFSIN